MSASCLLACPLLLLKDRNEVEMVSTQMLVQSTKAYAQLIRENLLRIFSILTLAGLFVVALNTDLRSNVRSALIPNYRVILAVAQADLDGSGERRQVLKVKTHEGLFLEVYGVSNDKTSGTHQELLASTKLPDKKDGYFTLNGEVTNLAIDTIDDDKHPKILATSFDSDLVAHLNVYKYVTGQRELELVHLK